MFRFKITPDKLNHIRKERLKSLGLSDGATYANINRIKEEIDHFENVVSKINCQVIDVSNKAIEETANIIVNAVQNQKCFSTFTKGECAFSLVRNVILVIFVIDYDRVVILIFFCFLLC